MQAVAFDRYLDYGKIGESRIARWIMNKRGYSILPVYEVELDTGKGPRIFAPTKKLIAPDMLAYRHDQTIWIEAKHKTAFTWHRITQRWTTGIDLRHYIDYCEIEDTSPFRVWLMFLHEGGQAKDSPPNSPSGLFGNSLSYLRENENHRHMNGGSGGMVYWNIDHLRKLADLDEL